MSIISKIKMPGMANAYDIGVDWENVKDKPDVGSIDVGVTNEVLNIDTNNDIAVSGSSDNEIPAFTSEDYINVLTVGDDNQLHWMPPGIIIDFSSYPNIFSKIRQHIQQIVNRGFSDGVYRYIISDSITEEDVSSAYISELQNLFINLKYYQDQTGQIAFSKMGNTIGGTIYASSQGTNQCLILNFNKIFYSDGNNLNVFADCQIKLFGVTNTSTNFEIDVIGQLWSGEALSNLITF